MKFSWKEWQPHLMAIGVFLVVSVLFCKPALEGLAVQQPDLMQWKGMAQDGFNYKERHGDFPEWTTSMFAGMPAYAIAFGANAYIAPYLTMLLTIGMPEPISYFFLCCVAFYFLSQVLRVNVWVGVAAALTYAYASYNPIIIVTGHHTKMMAIAYMPAMLGALLLLFERKKFLAGTAFTAMTTAAFVTYNHLQMVYYLLLTLLIMGLAYLIIYLRQKELKTLFTATGLAIAAGGLGILACAVNIFTTYDYAPETMRGGKANLDASFGDSTTAAAAKASQGLDVDYAFRWSYGIPETLTLLVPYANGGASKSLGEESRFYETIIEKIQTRQIDQGLAQSISRFGSEYWGEQPFTSGPVYLGAVMIFLAMLGLVAAPARHKWWMLAASVVGIVLAWGSHFMVVNEFLFHYLPMYNKFRAPSQSLVIPQLLIPVLGMLGVQALLDGGATQAQKWQWLQRAGIITGALAVLAVLYYFAADYKSSNELAIVRQIADGNPQIATPVKDVLNAAAEDRQALYRNDLLRSLTLIAVAFGLLMLFVKGKANALVASLGLVLLVLIDQLPVANRYLGSEDYTEKENTDIMTYLAQVNPALYRALGSLQQADKDPHYRVFNTTTDAFNDALTSAMARSVGGYHPAKLSLYQDIIEHQLSKQNMTVYNMLNTRYFLVGGEGGTITPQYNPAAMGPAWLVKEIQYVASAAEEMRALDSLAVEEVAVVQTQYKEHIAAAPQWDSTASIALTVYDNDLVEYAVKAPTPQFAVLSEAYYSRGWKAYANDVEVPIVKTNYILRGVALPAGTTTLRLEFKPRSYYLGRTVTTATEVVIVLLLLVSLLLWLRGRKLG